MSCSAWAISIVRRRLVVSNQITHQQCLNLQRNMARGVWGSQHALDMLCGYHQACVRAFRLSPEPAKRSSHRAIFTHSDTTHSPVFHRLTSHRQRTSFSASFARSFLRIWLRRIASRLPPFRNRRRGRYFPACAAKYLPALPTGWLNPPARRGPINFVLRLNG